MKGHLVVLLVLSIGILMWKHAGEPVRENGGELATAVLAGDVETVRQCLKRGGATTDDSGLPLLGLAAWHGQHDVMRTLLDEFGFDVNERSPTGWSPLMMAVLGGNPASIDMLLHAGADPGARTDTGTSALSMALDRGQQEIADRILAAQLPADLADPGDPGCEGILSYLR